jgi:hypothetical protein
MSADLIRIVYHFLPRSQGAPMRSTRPPGERRRIIFLLSDSALGSVLRPLGMSAEALWSMIPPYRVSQRCA